MSTPYHCQYWAHLLSLRGTSGSIESLSRSISNARVDLNPHQVDAALFAFRSPLSKGVILADEVGLGKTIEAGIILSQRWAERRRRIILILPATLRKQWLQELEDKFHLPAMILESTGFNQMKKAGIANPFEQEKLVLCSYHFAAGKADEIRKLSWDLVVIDEAHRLRNVYKKDNKIARTLSSCLGPAQKLLLTATPLQNSLMELFGLVSIIDPHVFGDADSFREQFNRFDNEESRNTALRQRLKPICTRTLRKQVLEYIRFTQRVPITQDFTPSDQEHELYEKVSAYLQRETLSALPSGQRKLMTMVLRKLLSSSTFAISGTLNRLVKRLEKLEPIDADIAEDYESLEETKDEWEEDEVPKPPGNLDQIREELKELRAYAYLAETITHNAKGDALIAALKEAMRRTESLGALQKAVIFTESRRTQQFLFDLLRANGYAGKLAMLNGTNSDPHSKEIYEQWRQRHQGKSIVSGSKSVDIKAAIVEEFKDRATILIATEAAAEGVNLQFCSLVVNYDLPWNPQRIEQRIGRCHRYGQEHDVVVVNFLNRRNEADQRVFQLLSEKFRLFDGVFGASDDVLGAIESGVDLERRIAEVYQDCRTAQEIQIAFDKLQSELDTQIQSRMAETRQTLLDNFDEEVHARLKVHKEEAQSKLSERERCLLALTRHSLDKQAKFEKDYPRFEYSGPDSSPGFYHLDWRWAGINGDTFYRADHPLAVRIIEQAMNRQLSAARMVFDYKSYHAKIAALEPFLGSTGTLSLSKLTIESHTAEEFLIFAALTDDGVVLDNDLCRKLMNLPGKIEPDAPNLPDSTLLDGIREEEIGRCVALVEARNGRFFDEEVAKLERWSDDLKITLEQEIKALDQQIKETRRGSQMAVGLPEKLAAQRELRTLETKRNEKRRQLYGAQDAVDEQRSGLITQIEKQLQKRQATSPLFSLRWRLE